MHHLIFNRPPPVSAAPNITDSFRKDKIELTSTWEAEPTDASVWLENGMGST